MKTLASRDWYTPEYKGLDEKTQEWMESTFRNEPTRLGAVLEMATDNATPAKPLIESAIPAPSFVDKNSIRSWDFQSYEYSFEQLVNLCLV